MKNKLSAIILALTMLMTPLVSFAATAEVNPDTKDWFVYEYPKAEQVKGTILDSSDILDAPAGKHGFLTHYEGDTFMFEDGTEAHFWGVNVASDHYMDKNEAIARADRIAQSGFNLVRLHLMDIGSLWGPKADGNRVMREDQMDKLCFFISELKARGIYIYIDLMIGKPYTSELDKILDLEYAGKVYEYFVSDLKERYKQNAEAFLNYRNKYTGKKLKDESAIVMMELFNESALCYSEYSSEKYAAELTKQYNDWLRAKYGNTETLKAAWTSDPGDCQGATAIGGSPLKEGESLEDGTVRISMPSTESKSAHRWNDEYMFKAKLEEEHFNDVIGYLRDLGVKYMITGSTSWASNGLETFTYYANRNTGYTDTHIYSGNWNFHQYKDSMTRTDSVGSVLDQGDGNTPNMISMASIRRVFGHPYVISEWNDNPPNRFRGETILMMGAYSSLQGMNPILFQWHSSKDTTASSENVRKEVHEAATQPEYLAAFPAIGRIVLRGDIQETDASFPYKRYRGNEQFGGLDQYMGPAMYSNYMGFVGKTGIVFEDQYNENLYDNKVLQLTKEAYEGDKNFVSVTGELSMDFQNKMFRMNTAKSQAIAGYTQGNTVELDDVKFALDNYHATAYLNSVDDAPLYESRKMLLTVIGDTRNTGQVMSEDEKTLVTSGTAPILVEPITGTVTIKTNVPITVQTVSPNGAIKQTVPTTPVAGGYSFELQSSYQAMYYQITKTSAGSKNEHISLGNTTPNDVFTDVNSQNASKDKIERVALAGYMPGTSATKFDPTANVKKKDFIAGVARALRVDQRVWYDKTSSSFKDLDNTDPTYGCMEIARYLGAISTTNIFGNNYIFPNANVKKDDAMNIITKFLGNGRFPTWITQRPDVSSLLSQYGNTLTRQEAAEIVYALAWE